MTQYAGIDYSLGKSNFDPDNGIHFGCINQNEVLQAWCDSSEPEYAPLELECPKCEVLFEYDGGNGEKAICPNGHEFIVDAIELFDDEQPIAFNYYQDGYNASSDDSGDIMIIKSPYYTYCQYCSPCAPGAGYLMNWFKMENGYSPETLGIEQYRKMAESAGFPKVYCFGHDWFDDGKAPYPVFSVETGELVKAPVK